MRQVDITCLERRRFAWQNAKIEESGVGTGEDRRRFWAKVAVPESDTACWEWVAGKFRRGYGMFMWASRYGRTAPIGAHRAAWELTHGPIPTDLQVLHSCDNRACVNPNHLFLGTHTDNMRDASAKGRLAKRVRKVAA